jgi:uncharacterized membrane protein
MGVKIADQTSNKFPCRTSPVFGLLMWLYSYNLTNYATLKGFPVNKVIIDLIWGTVLTSVVSLSGYYIVKLVG